MSDKVADELLNVYAPSPEVVLALFVIDVVDVTLAVELSRTTSTSSAFACVSQFETVITSESPASGLTVVRQFEDSPAPGVRCSQPVGGEVSEQSI